MIHDIKSRKDTIDTHVIDKGSNLLFLNFLAAVFFKYLKIYGRFLLPVRLST